ncbi:hypothetical protein GCM10009753_58280 [Streptantibioticus ferralitis]
MRAWLSGAETADAGTAAAIATAAADRTAADTAALESLVNTGFLHCFRACGSDTPTHKGGWMSGRDPRAQVRADRRRVETGSAGAEPVVRTGSGGLGDGLGKEVQGGSRG